MMTTATVLIADDLKEFLLVARAYLVRRGFEVFTAENGAKAVELARARHPRLILLDYMMPEIDGAAACAAMRRDPSLAFTPLLVMSATGTPEARERCIKAGCTKFVLKPVNPDDLLKVMAHILSIRERKVTHMSVVFNEVPATEGRQQIGMSGNLSGTGMLLLSGKALHAGALLHLEFVLPKTTHTIKVQGKVTNANLDSQGTYGAGIHFIDQSQTDQKEILAFISS